MELRNKALNHWLTKALNVEAELQRKIADMEEGMSIIQGKERDMPSRWKERMSI